MKNINWYFLIWCNLFGWNLASLLSMKITFAVSVKATETTFLSLNMSTIGLCTHKKKCITLISCVQCTIFINFMQFCSFLLFFFILENVSPIETLSQDTLKKNRWGIFLRLNLWLIWWTDRAEVKGRSCLVFSS